MTSTISSTALDVPQPTRRPSRSRQNERSHRTTTSARRTRPSTPKPTTIARYANWLGAAREIVAQAGFAGSVLVLDRDASTLGDRRLVAHLAADEPPENAMIVARCYLAQAQSGRCRCRPFTAADLQRSPFSGDAYDEVEVVDRASGVRAMDRLGDRYELCRLQTGMSIPELRWSRCRGEDEPRPVSAREAIAQLESYEPIRALTRRALDRHDTDESVSTTVLRGELARVQESPIVLNRGLRAAVRAAVEREGLSMSEIAIRCGRIKRDACGNASGETSWLARRLGLLPEGGRHAPTPWIHSNVLALIARDGLGVSPREVEVQ